MEFDLATAIIGALAVFVGIYTLGTAGRSHRVATRLGRLDRAYRGDGQGLEEAVIEPFFRRVGIPFWQRMQATARGVLPSSVANSLEHRIVLAGEPMSLFTFLALQLGAGALAVGILGGGLALGLTTYTNGGSAHPSWGGHCCTHGASRPSSSWP